jgi:hypothetical protein
MTRPPRPRSLPVTAKEVIPDLPPFDVAAILTLAEAIGAGLVKAPRGGRPSQELLQRWCTRGCRIVPDRPKYLFPSIKQTHERWTCRAWCEAFQAFAERLRADHTRRQVEMFTQMRDIVRADPK